MSTPCGGQAGPASWGPWAQGEGRGSWDLPAALGPQSRHSDRQDGFARFERWGRYFVGPPKISGSDEPALRSAKS